MCEASQCVYQEVADLKEGQAAQEVDLESAGDYGLSS